MDRNLIKKRLTFWYSLFWILFFIALFLAYGVYFVDLASTKSKWIGLFAGAIAFFLGSIKMLENNFFETTNEQIKKITQYFKNGAYIYTKRLFKISLVFTLMISCFLIKPMGIQFVLCFICGSVFLLLSILISTFSVSKTTTQLSCFYNESNNLTLKQILNSSITVSFISIGLAIIPLIILYHITKDYQILNGFAFGCVLIAVLNNILNNISKQAIKSGNEIICGYVAEIEAKDKRNPLLLLDGITKSILNSNVIMCDLIVSLVISLIAAMTIGGEHLMLMGAFLPIILISSAIFACVGVSLFINFTKIPNIIKNLFNPIILSGIIYVLISYFLIKYWYPDLQNMLIPIILGTFGGIVATYLHSNFIFKKYKPIVNASNAAISGFESTIKQIVRDSFGGIIFCALFFAFLIIASFLSCYGLEEPSFGVYGVMLMIISMLSCSPMMITNQVFGSTINNSKYICENYEEDINEKQNVLINSLSEDGFETVALTKNYTFLVGIFASISALIAYSALANLIEADILNPYVMSSLIIGLASPFMYCAFSMGVVSKTARRLVLEVKRQFRKSPQILRFEMRPDYEKCIDIAVINSSIQIVFNCLIIIAILALIAIFLKQEALLGFVFGVIISSLGIIFVSNTTKNISHSAKKYFESQYNCAQSTQEYSAINLNNKIFSSFFDVSGSILIALVKFIATVALCFVPLII